jgi:hypothetical protein
MIPDREHSHSHSPEDDDLALDADLRAAAAMFDPVPPWLERAATDAFDLRQIDAELAELVFDSWLEHAVVRGESDPRLLTFQAGDAVIDVELSGTGNTRRMVGHLLPAGPARVEVRSPRGTVAVPVDALGRFATPLPAGPFSLICRWPQLAPEQVVVTDWITVP